jgi:hypothetical protein
MNVQSVAPAACSTHHLCNVILLLLLLLPGDGGDGDDDDEASFLQGGEGRLTDEAAVAAELKEMDEIYEVLAKVS